MKVTIERFIDLAHSQIGVSDVVHGTGSVGGQLQLLLQIECPLEVGQGFVVVTLLEIEIADIVQANALRFFIAELEFNLKRALGDLQGFIVLALGVEYVAVVQQEPRR